MSQVMICSCGENNFFHRAQDVSHVLVAIYEDGTQREDEHDIVESYWNPEIECYECGRVYRDIDELRADWIARGRPEQE